MIYDEEGTSRGQSRWVSWEQRSFANVVESTEELDYAFEAETCSRVRRCTVLESFNVVFNLLDRYALGLCSFGQHCWVVHSLCSARDFLSTHEKVVRVGVVGIIWVYHGVERPRVDRIPIQHVKVSVVLGPH